MEWLKVTNVFDPRVEFAWRALPLNQMQLLSVHPLSAEHFFDSILVAIFHLMQLFFVKAALDVLAGEISGSRRAL